MSDTLTLDDPDYSAPGWWLNLPSVDGIPATTTRDPENTPGAAGEIFLESLAADLLKRAQEEPAQAFIATLTQQRKPRCVRVLLRGIVVCSHSVPKLKAWFASTGDDVLIWPLAGCGAFQTSTKASAGTHAGGGAGDYNANPHTPAERVMVMRKAREVGLHVGWCRKYIAGLWTNHYHILDPDCPELASVAAAQCVECFAGGDGLIGSRPDDGWRGNIPQLKTIFNNRLYLAVSDIGTGIEEIGKEVADRARVMALQAIVKQPKTGYWDIETDFPLAEIRTTARGGYTGAEFKAWSLAKRKAAQRVWGVTADGVWGPKTKAAAVAMARKVQGALSVTVDGIWGKTGQTEKAYSALRLRTYRRFRFSRPTGAFPTPGRAGSFYGPNTPGRPWYSGASAGALSQGLIQWQIRRIQRMVGAAPDGLYRAGTTAAVKRWQAAHKISADGIVGPATWAAMVKANVT